MKFSKITAIVLACILMISISGCSKNPVEMGNESDGSGYAQITTSDVDETSSNSADDISSKGSQKEENAANTSSKQNSDKNSDSAGKTPVSSSAMPSTEQTVITPQKPDTSETSSKKPAGSTDTVIIPSLTDTPNKNKALTPISAEDYYGWTWLKKNGTEAEKNAYLLFVSEIGKYNATVNFDFNITKDEVEKAYNLYKGDYPEHFWRGTSYTITREGTKVKRMTLSDMLYGGNSLRIKSLKQTVDNKVESVLSKLNDDMSDFEKEVIIHNYIVENTVYAEGENSHNMAGPLVDGVAVCEGYSLAFQYLMLRAGVPCITVLGSLNGDSHMWNMAEIDGDYYHVDVTADDPIMDSSEQVLTFDYFNLTETEIKIDHTIKNNAIDVPSATAKKYEYFTKTNQVYNKFSVENFAYSIAFAYKNGLNYASMRFESVNVNDAGAFISENYYDIIDRANAILGSEKIIASGRINLMYGEGRNILNLKTNY